MTFKIKLTGNFVLLTTTFNLRSIFQAKLGSCVCTWLYRAQPTYTILIEMTWVVLFGSLEHILTTIKRKFRFSYLCILYRFLWRHVNFSDPLYRGVPVNWFQISLSSMTLYNHPSYFKSGEINSRELSPLPNLMQLINDALTTMLKQFSWNLISSWGFSIF